MSPSKLYYGNTQSLDCVSPDASIKIINPDNTSTKRPVNAIVDSGAMMTCIPESMIKKLGQLRYSFVNARDFNGNITQKYTYYINIELETELFTKVEVIAHAKDYALIGRDILNRKKVTLDAPEEVWIYDCQGSCPLNN